MEATDISLTENGVAQIGLRKEEYVHEGKERIFLQITEFKDFAHDDTKKNIRFRLKLSDGFSQILALVQKQVYDELKLMNFDFKAFDIISISKFEKKNV